MKYFQSLKKLHSLGLHLTHLKKAPRGKELELG